MKRNKQFYQEKKYRKLKRYDDDNYYQHTKSGYININKESLGTCIDRNMCPANKYEDAEILSNFLYVTNSRHITNSIYYDNNNNILKNIIGYNFKTLNKGNQFGSYINVSNSNYNHKLLKEYDEDMYNKYTKLVPYEKSYTTHDLELVEEIDDDGNINLVEKMVWNKHYYTEYFKVFDIPLSWFKYDVRSRNRKIYKTIDNDEPNLELSQDFFRHYHRKYNYKNRRRYVRNDWTDYEVYLEKKYEIRHDKNYYKKYLDEEYEFTHNEEYYAWDVKYYRMENNKYYDDWIEYSKKQKRTSMGPFFIENLQFLSFVYYLLVYVHPLHLMHRVTDYQIK